METTTLAGNYGREATTEVPEHPVSVIGHGEGYNFPHFLRNSSDILRDAWRIRMPQPSQQQWYKHCKIQNAGRQLWRRTSRNLPTVPNPEPLQLHQNFPNMSGTFQIFGNLSNTFRILQSGSNSSKHTIPLHHPICASIPAQAGSHPS